MNFLPVEITAVILGAVLTFVGWLIKNLIWNPIRKAWTSIRTDITAILEFMNDAKIDKVKIGNELQRHSEKLEEHESTLEIHGKEIESLKHWTREVTIEHKHNHPDSELQVI